MKHFKYNSKEYHFVNEVEIDGVIHAAYRSPMQRKTTKLKGGRTNIVITPGDAVIVIDKKVKKVKDLKSEWFKIHKQKKHGSAN